jgi:hypothetical protein
VATVDDLLDHLQRLTGADRARLRHLVEEVLAYYNETAEQFVVRRHRELQREGLRNEAIFARVTEELATRRVRAPALNARRLRRIVYG